MFFKPNGILGINARNLLYIRPYNKKKAIKLADDKLKTKQFLSARGVPVPKLIATIKKQDELDRFNLSGLPNSFVIKPNKGFGGEGIIPIKSWQNNKFTTVSDKKLNNREIMDHLQDIIDGRFSISNVADYAFMEQLIMADDRIGKFSYAGLPDIRVVVHNLIPVMAMLRLPTRESEGKANLHMGAVGVGIDIAKGEATHITYKNKIIDEVPDGKGKIRGLKIPYWEEILHISSQVQLITNLGYMAVDICIDKNSGPVLLEINARAGLGVQIANLAPLRKRLERIEGVKVTTPTKGVRIAKDMFGFVVEKEIKNLSGKQVISTSETAEIIQKDGTLNINARIDTTRDITCIDKAYAKKAKLLTNEEDYDSTKQKLKIKFSLKGQRLQTIANIIDIDDPHHKMILGRRDLQNFLIDTSSDNRQFDKPQTTSNKLKINKTPNYKLIDQSLISLDKKIKLLYHLKPENLEEEKAKFIADQNYNPQFIYPELKFNPLELEEELSKIKPDQSPLGQIFQKKKKEISQKIHLLESIGDHNFTENSIKLFSEPNQSEINEVKKLLEHYTPEIKPEETYHDAVYAKKKFEEAFLKYGLTEWKVKLKDSLVADCIAGKSNRLFIRSDAKFTASRIKALIVHEIETHIITAANGSAQAYESLNRGLSNYLVTQEGMAMYNVEQQMQQPFTNNVGALSHVLAVHYAKTHSFAATYKYLTQTYSIPPKRALKSTIKVKRGLVDTSEPGCFTKDIVYYKGYKQVQEFIENGGKMKDLYLGKINLKDLEIIKKIPQIKEARIVPEWLRN